jgi:16S rRNA (cytosine1402-N4)-methyltransferase
VYHKPVLVSEVLDGLQVEPGGVYIDATLGEGGHSSAILERSAPDGRVLGIDLDGHALQVARRRLQPSWSVATLVRGNFAQIGHLARIFGSPKVSGVLMDLGLSSLQLEGSGRGFSFLRAEPLDMRFDPEQDLTANDVVNHYSQQDLAQVLYEYGEEPRSRAIAARIVERRPIKDSLHLSEIIEEVLGKRRSGIHPATRTFQAIRMEVNGELRNLREGLERAVQLLNPEGRLAVISYHSLEDRIVKEFMRGESQAPQTGYGIPAAISRQQPTLRVITKRIIRPGDAEVEENPRSRSAKLRVAARI